MATPRARLPRVSAGCFQKNITVRTVHPDFVRL